MSYNLETRVERLERQRPENPYEQMTDEELQARLDCLNERLSQMLGFNTRDMNFAESQMLIQAEAGGEASVNTVVE
jgi:hypothetical protein